jgi:hypothetical protein
MRPDAGRLSGRDNLRSPLARRRTAPGGMADFDRLPAALRRWLNGAALPWSPASARRVWVQALARAQGCEATALAALDQAQARRLAREQGRTAGPGVAARSEKGAAADRRPRA